MKNVVDLDLNVASINEITARYPDTIAVFNELGVDACCGGEATLREAAERDDVNLEQMLSAVRRAVVHADATARA